MSLLDSFLALSDTSAPWTIRVSQTNCGTHFSICSIKGWPFIIEGDSFVFSTLQARFQHQIQAFLWKTAVILIDEIQRCPKQSGGSPTVAHRRGASSVVIVPPERKERVRRTPGGEKRKNKKKRKSRFSVQKGQKSRSFFTGSGKVEETLLLFFVSLPLLMHSAKIKKRHGLIETGQNGELIMFTVRGWCYVCLAEWLAQTHPPCAHSSDLRIYLIVRHAGDIYIYIYINNK